MKKAIFTILLMFCSIAAFCQHDFKQKLKNIATIIFPDTPKVSDKSTFSDTVFYTENADGAIFLSEVSAKRKTPKEMFMSHLQDTIYDNLIKGTLNSDQYKYKLIYKKNIVFANLEGIEFSYTTIIKGHTYYGYNQAFYFNNTLVNNSVWSSDSLTGERKLLKDFFGTFKLTIRKGDIRQSNTSVIALGIKYALLILLGFALILTLIIFLAKRRLNQTQIHG